MTIGIADQWTSSSASMATSQKKCNLVSISIIRIVRPRAQWRHEVRNTTIGNVPGRWGASSCSGNHPLCPPTKGAKPHVKLVHILLEVQCKLYRAQCVWHKKEQIENCTRGDNPRSWTGADFIGHTLGVTQKTTYWALHTAISHTIDHGRISTRCIFQILQVVFLRKVFLTSYKLYFSDVVFLRSYKLYFSDAAICISLTSPMGQVR